MRRNPPDLRKLSRAIVAMAQAEAEAEAQAKARTANTATSDDAVDGDDRE